jgi:hypothetical protein
LLQFVKQGSKSVPNNGKCIKRNVQAILSECEIPSKKALPVVQQIGTLGRNVAKVLNHFDLENKMNRPMILVQMADGQINYWLI